MDTQITDAGARRVYEYHCASRYTFESVRSGPYRLDRSNRPAQQVDFNGQPKVALTTNLLDEPVGTLSLLNEGAEAAADLELEARPELRTLATWLFMSNGLTRKEGEAWIRSCPSLGWTYPYELYVAVRSIEGLEPGVYHYCPAGFALTRLRSGGGMVSRLAETYPELNGALAAVVVTSVHSRAGWRFKERGYRIALLEAGHQIENLMVTGKGLGMSVSARIGTEGPALRRLIGLRAGSDSDEVEAVQGLVVWRSAGEDNETAGQVKKETGGQGEAESWVDETGEGGEVIERARLCARPAEFESIAAVQEACVEAGEGREAINGTFTQASPLAGRDAWVRFDSIRDPQGGVVLREVLLKGCMTRQFSRLAIDSEQLVWINRLGFRGGTYWPLAPEGRQAGLVRPYWIVHHVDGMEPGVWHYDPIGDRWALLRAGEYRSEAAYLAVEQVVAGEVSAVCLMTADVGALLSQLGPLGYRLAHLEAGIAGERLYLSSQGMGLGCALSGTYYDWDAKRFLGLKQTGWEVIYMALIGHDAAEAASSGSHQWGGVGVDRADPWYDGWTE